jgi:hypothetical protein
MEIGYYCKHCNFYTKNISIMKRHLTQKKHVRTTTDVLIDNYNKSAYRCTTCEKIYSSVSNVNKHIKICHFEEKKIVKNKRNDDELHKWIVDSVSNIKDTVQRNKLFNLLLEREVMSKIKDKELEYTSKLKDKDLECASKINNIYENENKFHKKVVENAGQIVNKTINMLTYATQNFKETPKLETLDSTTARKLLKHEVNGGKNVKVNDDQVAEYIAKISEAKILPKHLGNTLVSHYKKDDPDRQSIWTTDVNRIKFIAKTTDGWIKDNNCDIINKAIITPLLKEVTKVMDEYCNDRMNSITKMTGREEAKYVEVSEQRVNIKSDMITEKLNKAILKHISPCFLMQKQLV